MRAHYDALAVLAARVMSLMAIGLGLDARMVRRRAIERHTSALRALHYPDLTDVAVEPGQLRAGAHSDYGTLTLLRQDDAPGGLQVRDVDGVWHDVPSVAGAYVVNVGDALARWTNDRWVSTVHRVAVPPPDVDRGRPSGRRWRSSTTPTGTPSSSASRHVSADGEPPRYPPVTAGRHLMDKFRSTQSGRALGES